MKFKRFLALTSSIVLFNSSFATANPLACQAILCLSTVGGVPPACMTAREAYFINQIWSPYFNGPATALKRQAYLLTCEFGPTPDPSMPSVLLAINTKYGMMMYDPGY